MPVPARNGRVGVVCVDLFKTLVELRVPEGVTDPDWATKSVYAEVYEVSMSDPRIQELPAYLNRIRRDENERSVTKQLVPFWMQINLKVGKCLAPQLGKKDARERANEVHRIFTGTNPNRFQLTSDTKQALDELMILRDEFVIALTTNSSSSRMTNILNHFNIGHYFDRKYSSGWIGVRKPLPQFWMAVRGGAMLPIVSLMGNSMKTDAPISNIGTIAHLLDQGGRLESKLQASTNREFPRWAHLSYQNNRLRFHPSTLSLVRSIIAQMDEQYTKTKISSDPDA